MIVVLLFIEIHTLLYFFCVFSCCASTLLNPFILLFFLSDDSERHTQKFLCVTVQPCDGCTQSFQTHLKEFVPMAAEQSVRLGLILAVQGIHSKLILLHTRLTSYNTDYS